MKNPLLDWVLLIPWALLLHFLLLSHAFENRFRSRGASLLLSSPVEVNRAHLPTYYYYDSVAPVTVRQRRQRQFSAEPAPVVTVLQTGRQSPATVHIKELPLLSRLPPMQPHFFTQQQTFSTRPPPPPVTQQTFSTRPPVTQQSTSTSFARFNQFGHDLFSIATSPTPSVVALPMPPENRFSPVLPQQHTDRLTGAPVLPPTLSSAVPTLAPPSFLLDSSTADEAHQISPRTLFGGFSSTGRETTTPTSTTTTTSSTASTLHQRPLFASTTATTRFLRPRTPVSAAAAATTLSLERSATFYDLFT